jgi:hypothetical protein
LLVGPKAPSGKKTIVRASLTDRSSPTAVPSAQRLCRAERRRQDWDSIGPGLGISEL